MTPLPRQPHFENLCFKSYTPHPLSSLTKREWSYYFYFSEPLLQQGRGTWAIADLSLLDWLGSHPSSVRPSNQSVRSLHSGTDVTVQCIYRKGWKWESRCRGGPEDLSWKVNFLPGTLFLLREYFIRKVLAVRDKMDEEYGVLSPKPPRGLYSLSGDWSEEGRGRGNKNQLKWVSERCPTPPSSPSSLLFMPQTLSKSYAFQT